MQLPDFLTQESPDSIRFAGHRIALEHVIFDYHQGYSPEMLLGQFPTLSLCVIHKAIAFYLEHSTDVDIYLASYQSEMDRGRSVSVLSPDMTELRRRMAELSKTSTP